MTKHLDSTDGQEATIEAVGDGLKAWLTSQEDAPAPEAADGPENASQKDVRPADTPNGSEPQDDTQEPQDEPVDPNPEEGTADSPEAAEEPENTPQEDANEEDQETTEEDPQQGVHEADTLQARYAALEAKIAELEAREAARVEAAQKAEALAEAGIKGNYSQLLTGSSDTWASQISLLKEFAAENTPAVPRDPAVDADFFDAPEEVTADAFLRSRSHDGF